MTRMSRIKYAVAAAVLVSALWAQSDEHPASNSAVARQPAQSKPQAAPATVGATPDSTDLEPVKTELPTYPNAAREQNIRGQVAILSSFPKQAMWRDPKSLAAIRSSETRR